MPHEQIWAIVSGAALVSTWQALKLPKRTRVIGERWFARAMLPFALLGGLGWTAIVYLDDGVGWRMGGEAAITAVAVYVLWHFATKPIPIADTGAEAEQR